MAAEPDPALQLIDNPAEHRYELREAGAVLVFITYRIEGGRMTMVHTETDPAAGGRGLASRLADFALRDAADRSLLVVPSCPFVRGYLVRHPELRHVVAPGALDVSGD
ncbi:MAG TPA: GNAT family N-acetyltransferase [Acidimicrobiales bacterium]|jgi:predicted GNAT family acetyltransferase